MAKAIWNGVVIAESADTEMVEGHHYFPMEAIHADYFKQSQHHSVCPWKGEASYYTLEVDGQENPNAAWFYPDPKPAAAKLKGRVAFWKGVKVEA